ncbi:unnamed protein product [Linum tenue]|uniref:Uncharacterized protein n=1 Tax=Linum tenue TaxID=586396 RepID=A0AAV0RNU0_9ROSI|nr:unnamed protein product [Linum tenue]
MCTTAGNGGAGDGESPSASSCWLTKKTAPSKKQRVPKRGPGVAELEKILREQGDHKKASTTSDVAVVPPPPHPPSPSPPPAAAAGSSLPSSPPPPLSSSATKTPAFPPRSQLYSFLPQPTSWNPGESSHDAGNCSKSEFRFPFSPLLGSNGSSDQQAVPSPVFFQRSQQHSSCPAMMNLFPQNSSAAEPPSNQTALYRRSPVSLPEEDTPSVSFKVSGSSFLFESSNLFPHILNRPPSLTNFHCFLFSFWVYVKMVGTKRSCPYTMDVPQIPVFRYQVPSYLPQVTESVSTFSPGSHYNANYRGQSSSYPCEEQSSRRWSGNSNSKDPAFAEGQGSFVLLGCPTTTTRIPKQQHLNFNPPMPHQETNRTMDRPANKLPFYSFIVPEDEGGQQEMDQAETELSFVSGREMTRGDEGLDLSLKL